jgi:hypothetical protein
LKHAILIIIFGGDVIDKKVVIQIHNHLVIEKELTIIEK